MTNNNNLKKAVVWGHKLTTPEQSHTHSFVHQSFFNAFKAMGYETHWVDDNDSVDSEFFSNSIFLTEGQVDNKIPIRDDCKYILHNCNLDKYDSVISNTLNLQVYTHDCLSRQVEKMEEPLTYYQPKPAITTEQVGCNNRTLYQPWATNLIPSEIQTYDVQSLRNSRMRVVFWVGSIYGGWQGNVNELQDFANACQKSNIVFSHSKIPEDIRHIKAIQHSWVAPAIQGAWQVEKGYIPCRVFKNISYGRVPGTNSTTVNQLFDNQLPFSTNMSSLLTQNESMELNLTQDFVNTIMNEVKTKHTYINRVKTILKVL